MKTDTAPTPREAITQAIAKIPNPQRAAAQETIRNFIRQCGPHDDVTHPGFAAQLAMELRNEHRTTQQLFWGVILEVLKDYATCDEGQDGRNSASKEWARRIIHEIDILGFTYV